MSELNRNSRSARASEDGWWEFYREAELYFPTVDIGLITILAVCGVPFLFSLFIKDEMTAIFVGAIVVGIIYLAARGYNERQIRCAAKLADAKFKNAKYHS